MPCARTHASVPSLPSLTWTTSWCGAAECARRLSTTRRRCARLFQVGIRTVNIGRQASASQSIGRDDATAHRPVAQEQLVARDENRVGTPGEQVPEHLVAGVGRRSLRRGGLDDLGALLDPRQQGPQRFVAEAVELAQRRAVEHVAVFVEERRRGDEPQLALQHALQDGGDRKRIALDRKAGDDDVGVDDGCGLRLHVRSDHRWAVVVSANDTVGARRRGGAGCGARPRRSASLREPDCSALLGRAARRGNSLRSFVATLRQSRRVR